MVNAQSAINSQTTARNQQNMPRKRIPARTKTIVSCLYWWSFLITSTTPLFRYILSNQWYAVTVGGLLPAYDGVAEHPTKDRAFGWHALFALTWMTMAYIQICFMDHKKRTYSHKVFGYMTVLALMLHSMGALLILYEDVEGHTVLNRALLFSSLMATVSTVFQAIREAINGNHTKHRVLMVRAFISSLDGAGTIRTVANIQMVLGYGPVLCQCDYGKVGGNCDWTYLWRLMWVTVLRLVQWAVFCQFEDRKYGSNLMSELWEDLKVYHVPNWTLLIVCFLSGLDHQDTLVIFIVLFGINTVICENIVCFAISISSQSISDSVIILHTPSPTGSLTQIEQLMAPLTWITGKVKNAVDDETMIQTLYFVVDE